jgi:tol-pal system protein YbgF
LADNARYWLGETYYARGEYARSAEIFLDGYEKNKQSPKAPDTLLKLGLSLSGLGKKKEACASFRELGRAFPNAPEPVKDRAAQESKRIACG